MKNLIRRRRLDYEVEGSDAVGARSLPVDGATRINPTVSAAVISEAQNALEAAHTSGDYRYQSVGDLIRAALIAYGDGLRLTQQARNGRKKRHTVELPPELHKQYSRFPSRSRGVIVERALLAFLAQGYDKPSETPGVLA